MSDKEKSAISVMSGLRQKFARERNKGVTYSADELHLMFTESIKKIKTDEEIIMDVSESWDDIESQIERSKIKRYPWKELFRTSLSKLIYGYKDHGFTAEETLNEIEKDPAFRSFLEKNSTEKENILKNLRISVNSRYVESEIIKEVGKK